MTDEPTFEGFMDLGISNDVDPADFVNNNLVVFSSFGNDSVALIHWLYEHEMKNVIVVYSNTGWAAKFWPERVEKGRKLCSRYGFNFIEITSVGMKSLVKKKKAFPPNGMQFCTKELKIWPAMLWLQKNDPDKNRICVTGIRRQESLNRKNYPILMKHSPDHEGRVRWSPLAAFNEEDRNELIEKTGMEILPHNSMECFPCFPNANRADILMLPEDRIAEIEEFEKSMGFTKYGKPRTAFRPARHQGAVGIRDVVRWAKREPFEPDPDYIEDDVLPDDDGCFSGWCGT